MKQIVNHNRRHNQGIMPSPTRCCGGNEKSSRSKSPLSHIAFPQEESEVDKSNNSPSQWPKRVCANYGPPPGLLNKLRKAVKAKKTGKEDDGKEEDPLPARP
eukprot:12105890-Ditylum_brightwellii.AAC.1